MKVKEIKYNRRKMHLATKKSISNVKLYNLPSSIYASEMSRKCIFICKKAFKIFFVKKCSDYLGKRKQQSLMSFEFYVSIQ